MKKIITVLFIISLFGLVSACRGEASSSDLQRDQQEETMREGRAQVGLPSIINWRELKMLKDLYELRDQKGIATYTYVWSEFKAKYIFQCASIGYGIPYATQYSAPETMQNWFIHKENDNRERAYGSDRLPQPEPNGLYVPPSASGTWVMCNYGDKKGTVPDYVEPEITVSQAQYPCNKVLRAPWCEEYYKKHNIEYY